MTPAALPPSRRDIVFVHIPKTAGTSSSRICSISWATSRADGSEKSAGWIAPTTCNSRSSSVNAAKASASWSRLAPTALVHEAWLRLVGDHARSFKDRTHFFRASAEAMRRILVENARSKARQKRGGRDRHFFKLPDRPALRNVESSGSCAAQFFQMRARPKFSADIFGQCADIGSGGACDPERS